jgi:hypothetical protein
MPFEAPIDPHLQQLIQRYPRLFHSKPPGVESSIEPGWYALMDELCAGIDQLLTDEQAKKFKVLQIKEKFGALRFYFSAGRMRDVHVDIVGSEGPSSFATKTKPKSSFPMEQVRSLVDAACKKSSVTCKNCGFPGLLRSDGWLRVLCFPCEVRYQQALREWESEQDSRQDD